MITSLLDGQGEVSVDLALRLGKYFGVSPQMWLNLQQHYDAETLRLLDKTPYEAIAPYNARVA